MTRPIVPIVLGVAGLVPFLSAAIGAHALPPFLGPIAIHAGTIYAVAILAFLGGVHWGRALTTMRAGDFIWSVIPSLVAFFAMFAPRPVALAVLSAAFVVVGAYDGVVFARTGPLWYARLRLWLTLIVAVALAVLAFAAVDLRVDPFGSMAP